MKQSRAEQEGPAGQLKQSRAEQSKAEQSRVEQEEGLVGQSKKKALPGRAEQKSRAEQSKKKALPGS